MTHHSQDTLSTAELIAAFPQQVSCFANARTSTPDTDMPLGEVLARIRDGEWAAQVGAVRDILAAGAQDAAIAYSDAKKSLPSFAVSGTCKTRDKHLALEDKFGTHSGFLQCDVDQKDNPALADLAALKDQMAADKHVAAVFISPSGKGLKVILKISPALESHKASFAAAEKRFSEKYGVQIDRSTKDALRMCFVSHDTGLFVNPDAVPLLPLAAELRRVEYFQPPGEATTSDDIAEMLAHIPPNVDYDTRLRVASAVFSVLSLEEGCRVLNAWAPESVGKQGGWYAAKQKNRLKEVKIGTLVHIAKQHGFDAAAAAQRKRWCGRILFRGKPAGAEGTQAVAQRIDDMTPPEADELITISAEFARQCVDEEQRGAMRLLASEFAERWIYANDGKSWYHYAKGIWERDAAQRTKSIAHHHLIKTVDALSAEMLKAMAGDAPEKSKKDPRENELKKLRRYRDKCSLNNFMQGSLVMLQSEMGTTLDELDCQPMLLACENGTLDLSLGDFREHRAEDKLTKSLPVRFDVDAQCPKWEQFLNEIFQENTPIIRFIQRAVGYSLSGSVDADALFLLLGNGANGKSTFRAALEMLFGAYAGQVSISVLLNEKNDNSTPYYKAELKGLRLCFTDEIPDGKRFNESELKALTGGDLISARPIHCDPILFKPTHKLWLIGNHKPDVRDATDGTWRRLNLIWFKRQFAVGERRNRTDMMAEFSAELPGILNWALQGWLAYQQGGLQPPPEVNDAVSEYKNEQDQFGAFLEECLVEATGYNVPTNAVYGEYKRWCDNTGEFPRYRTQRKMTTALIELKKEIIKGKGNASFLKNHQLSSSEKQKEETLF